MIWLASTAAYVLVGLAIVQWWEPSGGGEAEARLSQWFDDQRTDQRNHLAEIGSAFSNTETKIGLLLILCPLMLWMYRRWHDWTFLAVGLIFETAAFFTASKIVRRERPQIEQLDTAPTFSWPSGHIAASVVFYVGIATVVFWNTRSKLSRAVFATIAVVVPIVVIICRLYLGMHYVTDADRRRRARIAHAAHRAPPADRRPRRATAQRPDAVARQRAQPSTLLAISPSSAMRSVW